MKALIAELESAAARLTRRVMSEMYRDPFWMERYGDRGRGHADTDNDFHVKYIVSALEADDPSLFATYGRWLRDLLVARGMCSRHLADNFDHLADAIAEEKWADREIAVAILRVGTAGLRHTTGDAAAIENHRYVWVATLGEDGTRADHVLSYVADALVTRQRAGLDSYIDHLARHTDAAKLLARIAALPGLPAAARSLIEGPR